MKFPSRGGFVLGWLVAWLASSGVLLAAPVNDHFANATVIAGATGSQSGSTTTATGEVGEPLHADISGGRSVWFRWTAPQSGRWIFRTWGSSYDTTLAVYSGTALTGLTPVASNDDDPAGGTTSLVEITATGGTQYHVAVDGYQGASGSYVLAWLAVLPPNDHFSSATPITGSFGSRVGFNMGATAEPLEPRAGNSIWYNWTAPRNMQAVFSTAGSDFDTFLAIYQGGALAGLVEVASNDNDGALTTSRVSFPATSGAVYRVQITGVGTAGGNVTVRWSEEGMVAPRLLPDLSVLASQPLGFLHGWNIDQTEIPGRTLLRVSTATPNSGAGPLELRGTTTSPLVVQRIYRADGTFDERPAGSFTFHPTHGHLHFDDWLQMHLRAVLPGNGVGDIVASGNKTSFAIIDLEPNDPTAPGYPAESVYEGSLLQGISVGWRDVYTSSLPDQWIDVTAIPPGQYWLEGVVDPENHVEESDETNNAARILITYAGAVPPNDNFANAVTLTGAIAGTTGRNFLATKEAGEPAHAGNAGGKSVWYRWTAPGSALVTMSTEGSDFDTLLAVYTGTVVGSLVAVAANDDVSPGVTRSALSFAAVAGTTYRIAVDGKGGAAGSLELAINPVGNDAFAAGRALSGASGTISGSSHGATVEAAEPAHAGEGGRSVWFTWTAPSAGEASFDTEGSAFDTVLAVYSGDNVGALMPIASDDDSSLGKTSRVIFTATASTTYRIAVDGHGGSAGIYALTWSVSASTVPYILAHPESANVLLGGTATFDVVAGGSQPRQFQWWHNGVALTDGGRISGAMAASLTVAKLQPSDSGSYLVVVTNGLGTVTSNTATLIALANPRAIHADAVTADLEGVLSLPVGIQAQGNENAVRFTITLDPATFLSPHVVAGPDAIGATLTTNLTQAASGRIGVTVTLPAGLVFAAGHREIAVIQADVSPFASPGETKSAGFISSPLAPMAFTAGGALLPVQTSAGSITLERVTLGANVVPQGQAGMLVRLRGLRGRNYALSYSADLIDWLPLAPGIPGPDGFAEVLDAGAVNVGARFYRWTRILP